MLFCIQKVKHKQIMKKVNMFKKTENISNSCISFKPFKEISKSILIMVISNIITILIFIFIFTNFNSILKYVNSLILYNFVAKELNIENHIISQSINKQVEDFYNDYKIESKQKQNDYGDKFLYALETIVKNNYGEFLKNNLKNIKLILDQNTYKEIKSLYQDLTFFWINLNNGSFGTDTSQALESYFEIIKKYKGKFPDLRKTLHDKNFKIFNERYWLPINLLIFEIYLRTLYITPKNANVEIKTNARFLFEITRKNLDNTFMILSMDD